MKVILSIEQQEYNIVLKYLHFKLPSELSRKFTHYISSTQQVFFRINEPQFDYLDLHFEIITNKLKL
jgi:hypothetical protein